MTEPVALMLLTAVAGGVGAVLRFVVDGAITVRVARRARAVSLPWGTLVVNLTGSLAIGLLTGVFTIEHHLTLVLGVGLLGGFTTLSTASVETVRLLQSARPGPATLQAFGQLVAAVAAVLLGYWIGSQLSLL